MCMGSIRPDGVKNIIFYDICFQCLDQIFRSQEGLENAYDALMVARDLQQKGFSPSIGRRIYYVCPSEVKDTDYERLTMDRLEEIAKKNEPHSNFIESHGTE